MNKPWVSEGLIQKEERIEFEFELATQCLKNKDKDKEEVNQTKKQGSEDCTTRPPCLKNKHKSYKK